jgi:hypothetical protein
MLIRELTSEARSSLSTLASTLLMSPAFANVDAMPKVSSHPEDLAM